MKTSKVIVITLLLLFFLVLLFSTSFAGSFEDKKCETGIAPGILFPGDVYISLLGEKVTHNSNFLIRSYFDAYVIPQISFGLYINYTSLNLERDLKVFDKEIKSSGTSILGIGASIKPRFIISPKFAIKPGLSIGHRQFFGENDFSEWKGLALNGSGELQYLLSEQINIIGELGFLYQPYGGNEDTDVTFDPIFYFVVGVAL
jgi:hypothetical protein